MQHWARIFNFATKLHCKIANKMDKKLNFLHKFLTILSLFSFLFYFSSAKLVAQSPTVQDCLGAIPICQDVYVEPSPYQFYGTNGNYLNEIFGVSGENCVTTEANGMWYSFKVSQSGALRFSITGDNSTDDYDWIVFDITNASCSALGTSQMYNYMVSSNNYGEYYGEQPVTGANSNMSGGSAGNCNGPGTENGPIWNDDISVTSGHTYVLYNSNWSNSQYGYTINFSASTASIYDQVSPQISTFELPVYCGSNQIVFTFSEPVRCSTVSLFDFQLKAPDGTTVPINSVLSTACSNGIPYSSRYTMRVGQVLQEGTYVLTLNAQTAGSVLDKCENAAVTKNYNVSVIANDNMVCQVTQPTCLNFADGKIQAQYGNSGAVSYSINGGTYIENGGLFENLAAGTYTISAIDGNSCISSETVIIQNPPQATANAGADKTLCNVTSSALSAQATPSGTGTWTCSRPEVVLSSKNSPTSPISNVPLGTSLFTWTVDDGVCGVFSDQIVITRYSTTTEVGPNKDLCNVSETALSVNDPFPGSGAWTTSNTSILVENSTAYTTTAVAIPFGNHTFTWTANFGACGIFNDSFTLVNSPLASEAQAGNDKTICADALNLDAVSPEFGTGKWSKSNSASIVNVLSNVSRVSNLSAGENIFTWTVSSGACPSNSDAVSVWRDLEPSTALVCDDKIICQNSISLCAQTPVVGQGLWTTSGAGQFVLANSAQTDVVNLAEGENVLVWTISNGICPPSTDSMTVTVGDFEAPVPDISTLPDILAQCDTTIYPPTAFDNCAGNLTAKTESALYFDVQGNYVVTWIYEDLKGNITTQNQTVIIEDNTIPEIICPNDTVIFLDIKDEYHTVSEFEMLPHDIGDNCGVYSFSNNYNYSDTLNAEIFVVGVTPVEWSVLDVNGNEGKCLCEIKVTDLPAPDYCPECGIFIPDAFSPNGSGKNDTFKIIGLRNYPDNSIQIFNRWGNKIFEAAPYDTPWDGHSMFGYILNDNEILPDGTYFYILKLKDSIRPITGYVYLKK